MSWLQAIIQGILLGGVYALFAVGLSLVFGTMRLVNLAHGDLIVLSSYVAFLLVDSIGFNPFYAIPITMVVMFAFGYALQRGLLNRIVAKGDVTGVIVTFGLSIVIINAMQQAFTANYKDMNVGDIETMSINVTDQLSIGWLPLIFFILSVVVIAALQLYMNHTKMGRAFRAVSDDTDAARLMGVNTKHVWAMAMAVALLIVSIAGAMMGIRSNFNPTLGTERLIFAFEAVIIGGMGSGWGTMLGGVILGVAQLVGAKWLGPGWQVVSGHVVFVLILTLRPKGLLAKTVTT